MQVNNQVLSLTGSLLADPTNPPPPPSLSMQILVPSPSVSLSPEPEPEPEPEPPTKKQRSKPPSSQVKSYQPQKPHARFEDEDAAAQPPEATEIQDQVDDRYLSQREQKKKRKEEDRKKRDARKARKEDVGLERLEEMAGEEMVDVTPAVDDLGVTVKRKGAQDGSAETVSKKKKTKRQSTS